MLVLEHCGITRFAINHSMCVWLCGFGIHQLMGYYVCDEEESYVGVYLSINPNHSDYNTVVFKPYCLSYKSDQAHYWFIIN